MGLDQRVLNSRPLLAVWWRRIDISPECQIYGAISNRNARGPAVRVGRLRRWSGANKFGLETPPRILVILVLQVHEREGRGPLHRQARRRSIEDGRSDAAQTRHEGARAQNGADDDERDVTGFLIAQGP
jgi:hypothetical protein